MTAPCPGSLLTYSQPWPEADLLSFLHLGKGHPRVFWESEQSVLALAGFGIAAEITASGLARFAEIGARARKLFANVHHVGGGMGAKVDPILVGGFSFREDFPTRAFSCPVFN